MAKSRSSLRKVILHFYAITVHAVDNKKKTLILVNINISFYILLLSYIIFRKGNCCWYHLRYSSHQSILVREEHFSPLLQPVSRP